MANGWRPILGVGGVPVQQSLTVDPGQYATLNMSRTVLGIVYDVKPADHEKNRSAQKNRAHRGNYHECTVVVVNDGFPCTTVIEHVIITPDALSGLDDYYEHLPRPSTQRVTGETLTSKLQNMDPYELDGDWCVVGFIGANFTLPYIVRWWPHPKNLYDAATSGKGNPDRNGRGRALIQDGRYFERINGVEHVITKRGDIYLSTRLSNSILRMNESSEDGRWPRTTDPDDGGSVHVSIKPTQMLELTWRTQAQGTGVGQAPDAELPQRNPPSSRETNTSDTDNTYVQVSKDTLRAETTSVRLKGKERIALTSEDVIVISAENGIDVDCSSATITVESTLHLGGTNGNTLIDSRWKNAWDAGITAVTALPVGSPEQNAAAIEGIQTFLSALQTALASSLTTKTKAE